MEKTVYVEKRSQIVSMESIYNDRIRPLLDAVDELRHLQVMNEGIQLPTIVVVGDQSSGKSSVLESLAGISLPRGQGICTRVPLIMRLQHHPNPEPELSLEFDGKTVFTDEANVADAISLATEEIAGDEKGISNTPLTLLVKKIGVPDLTMVDLPGITRVPVHGQPEDIYEQVSGIIMEYIKPEESIILNVISAAVDFSTCESIRMSRQVDKHGERTLAVVTKADKSPEGLLEKVAGDDVKIGLGYICVRNRIGDESYEEARKEEARIFASHPLLSKIDKSIVGIPVLAQKLVQIQATIIGRCLPGIVQKTSEKLSTCVSALNKMPRTYSAAEAMAAFMGIVRSAMESLRKVLLARQYDEFPDDENMHCAARLAEMLNEYQEDLHASLESDHLKDFLKEELHQLQETKSIELANFLPGAAFRTILMKKVNGISGIPVGFVEKAWGYIESVVIAVLMHHSENFYQLQLCFRRAGHMVVAKMKEQSLDWVAEYVEMEKSTDYTCSPEYVNQWDELTGKQSSFINKVFNSRPPTITISGFGCVPNSDYLKDCKEDLLRQAYDLRMRMTAYWNIIMRRFVDNMALHIQFSVQKLVNKEMERAIFDDFISTHNSSTDRIMEESPSVAAKREKLNSRIELLKKSKEVLANTMDKLAVGENPASEIASELGLFRRVEDPPTHYLKILGRIWKFIVSEPIAPYKGEGSTYSLD